MYHGEKQLIKEYIFLELHNLWHMKCICLENKMEKMKCHPFSFCRWSDIPMVSRLYQLNNYKSDVKGDWEFKEIEDGIINLIWTPRTTIQIIKIHKD